MNLANFDEYIRAQKFNFVKNDDLRRVHIRFETVAKQRGTGKTIINEGRNRITVKIFSKAIAHDLHF